MANDKSKAYLLHGECPACNDHVFGALCERTGYAEEARDWSHEPEPVTIAIALRYLNETCPCKKEHEYA